MSVNGPTDMGPSSPPHTTFSAVLLAGGASRRMGRDKRLLPWDTDSDGRERSLLQSIAARLAEVSSDVIVVANDEPDVSGARIVRDAFPGAGSLGGIYSGVVAADHGLTFVAGADMPFLDLGLVRHLVDRLGTADAVVPIISGRPEPLHAVYGRSVLGPAKTLIEAGRLKIAGLFEDRAIVWVHENELRAIDPELASFRNLNTPADYEKARADLAGERGAPGT